MPKSVYITKHAKRRTKQRVGIKKKDIETNAQKVLEYGLTQTEAKGDLARYMSKVYLRNGIPNNIRAYQHKLYLFKGNVLITVLDIPPQLCKLADKLQKQKNEKIMEEIHESQNVDQI